MSLTGEWNIGRVGGNLGLNLGWSRRTNSRLDALHTRFRDDVGVVPDGVLDLVRAFPDRVRVDHIAAFQVNDLRRSGNGADAGKGNDQRKPTTWDDK